MHWQWLSFYLWSFDIILNKFTVKLMKFTEVAEAGKRGDDLSKLFFREEYMLNYAIGELWFEVKTINSQFRQFQFRN